MMKTQAQNTQHGLMSVIEEIVREVLACKHHEQQAFPLLRLQKLLAAHHALLGLSMAEGFKGDGK